MASKRLALLAAPVALAAMIVAPRAAAELDYRSIFVDRFDYTYNSPNIPSMIAGIETIMQNSADLGFKHVIFQVRGRADALYNSNFEPPATGLTPGFDPLQTAITAAHAHGLKLHAWINVTPMWNSTSQSSPPGVDPPPGHIFHNTNPSFRLMDSSGNLEPQAGWSNYASVNPVLPEVHDHINNVVNDIAANYAVDGIHLDYIRYVPGALNFNRLPHDPIAHQMFLDATGLDGANPANFQPYKAYVKSRITDLVASIKNTVDAAEITHARQIDLTASVWRDPDVGENDYIQDYRTWLEQDLLDVAMPMIYLRASNDNLFNPNLLNTLNIPTNAKIAPNIGIYLHDDDNGGVALTQSQMQRTLAFGADGIGFYDYPAVFANSLTPQRTQAIREFFQSIDNPSPPPTPGVGNVIDDFEIDEGHFPASNNISPITQTFGLAAGTTIQRVETQAQTGVGSLELNILAGGPWQLRHNSGVGGGTANIAQPAGNVPLAATGSVGFWLKTAAAGLTVRIGIDDPVGNTALERGVVREVVGDDQWHLYQWDFDDASQWQAFAGGANGVIDGVAGTVTIDSIWLAGAGDALIYIDNVSHNSAGPLAAARTPGDFNDDGRVDHEDFAMWQTGFGATAGAARADGDADNNGAVDGADFLAWQRHFNVPAPEPPGAAVPEPTAAWLAAALLAALMWLEARERRTRRRTAASAG